MEKPDHILIATDLSSHAGKAETRAAMLAQALGAGKLVLMHVVPSLPLEALTNILERGRVGILFLIPGVDETLRVNGTAENPVVFTAKSDDTACTTANVDCDTNNDSSATNPDRGSWRYVDIVAATSASTSSSGRSVAASSTLEGRCSVTTP
mgnify:CR=1 FL=1